MDIDASINIGNEFPIDAGGTYKSTDPNKWVIMPKWECPTLDFPDRSGAADQYAFSSSVTPSEYTSSAQGMWHQYGVMPNSHEGAYLYIKDIPTGDNEEYDYVAIGSTPVSDSIRTYTYVDKIPKFVKDANRDVRSLADLCGFDSEEIIPELKKAIEKDYYNSLILLKPRGLVNLQKITRNRCPRLYLLCRFILIRNRNQGLLRSRRQPIN